MTFVCKNSHRIPIGHLCRVLGRVEHGIGRQRTSHRIEAQIQRNWLSVDFGKERYLTRLEWLDLLFSLSADGRQIIRDSLWSASTTAGLRWKRTQQVFGDFWLRVRRLWCLGRRCVDCWLRFLCGRRRTRISRIFWWIWILFQCLRRLSAWQWCIVALSGFGHRFGWSHFGMPTSRKWTWITSGSDWPSWLTKLLPKSISSAPSSITISKAW